MIPGKKILIVSPIECYPTTSGNSSRIQIICETLLALGVELYYLHFPEREFDPAHMIDTFGSNYFYKKYRYFTQSRVTLIIKALYTILLNKRYRNIRIDDLMSRSNIRMYKQIVKRTNPDIIWVNYTYYSLLFNVTPKRITRILDTHDSMYLRYNRIFNLNKNYKNLRVDKQDEIECINRADKVVCIQDEERLFFKQNGCVKSIVTLGHIVPFKATEYREKRSVLGYIATDYHTNIIALDFFLSNVWPLVKKLNPSTKLLLAGKISDVFKIIIDDTDILFLGVIEELASFYNSIDIAINPIQAGSGLKIKNIEPLGYGKPLITTTMGLVGLELFKDKGIAVANSVEEWQDKIQDLLKDDTLYGNMIRLLEDSISSYNSKALSTIKDLLI